MDMMPLLEGAIPYIEIFLAYLAAGYIVTVWIMLTESRRLLTLREWTLATYGWPVVLWHYSKVLFKQA